MTNTRKLLLFGKHGQVGSQLVKQLAGRESYTLVATDIEDVDLTDADGTRALVLEQKPDWVINTSAHTAVDRAETEQELSHQLNAVAPGIIANACADIGAGMIHYSTDYVFDGTASVPYLESDEPNPQSVYGRTKLEGERAVLSALDRALIFRTAWVYSKDGKNFVNTMLRLASERQELSVVCDQFGSPTLADDLAAMTISALDRLTEDSIFFEFGVYHATGQGVINWAEFSQEIMRLSGHDQVKVIPIASSEYPTPAPRPAYSALSNDKLKQQFGLELPHWQNALERCLGKV
ncbi:MAG: dTDP-4-dehydrorhamnose reductase [bacterium]